MGKVDVSSSNRDIHFWSYQSQAFRQSIVHEWPLDMSFIYFLHERACNRQSKDSEVMKCIIWELTIIYPVNITPG